MGQETQQQGGAPYPPPQGGVTAPGGYPVVSPGAGPSSAGPPHNPVTMYPPQPNPAAMEPPAKPTAGGPPPQGAYPPQAGAYPPQGAYPTAGHYTPAGPGPYPGAAPYPTGGAPHGGYPPQGACPAPGYPVPQGPPGAAGAYQTMSVEQAGQQAPGQEPCGCSIGWVLFAVGFLIWPCWVAAAFVPLCTRSRNDRLAGIASTIGLLVLVIIGIIIGATQGSRNRYY